MTEEKRVLIIGSCDWGGCDNPVVGLRFEDGQWFCVCEECLHRCAPGYRVPARDQHVLTDAELAEKFISLPDPPRRERFA